MSTTEYSQAYLNESRQRDLWAVSICFLVLETIAVGLRFLSKRLGRVKWGLDDVFILLGYGCCMTVAALGLNDVINGGSGLHEVRVLEMNPETLVTWGHMIIAIPLVYVFAVVFPKLAILHLFLSVFTDKRARLTCYLTAIVMLLNMVALFITGLLSCIPLSYYWTEAPGGHCININMYFRWAGFPNLLTDIVMLILPIPTVWALQLSTKMKWGVLVTFLLGSLGLISSLCRFIEFYLTDATVDGTWSATPLITWCMAECGIYLIAACLPLYRPLVRLFSRKKRSQTGTELTDTSDSKQGFNSTGSRASGRTHYKLGSVADDEEDALGLVSYTKVEQGAVQVQVERDATAH
ncbi:integral membrane protein [Aspergillus heteromorphus CBS 117.55]|uniref:Integral membrane protein n=1 Tax=Aspergillus heteromorphus CBS 117.55 TaxID=1448321 RepID=A0A317W9T8_9EURO|nr:uncharacterized protein BO70DRAFT_314724 [Aspergillus heteromorphus CBS 117.55]PWY82062.1 integral membrane protein [Aspergillus heteromorphus CBS 117.55]